MENRRVSETKESKSTLDALVALKMRLDSLGNYEPDKHESFMDLWQLLAGNQLDEMLTDIEKAKQNLQNPWWQIRLAAISILRERWKLSVELAPAIERMAFEDDHPQVRATALYSLACCFEGTNDLRIGKLLAGIVKNESLGNDLRESAYGGLFRLRGLAALHWHIPGTHRFPGHVDWQFVESFVVTLPAQGR